MDETTNSRDAANEADDREGIAGIEEKSRDKKGNKHKEKYEKKCSSGARAEWEQRKNRRFKKSTLVMMIVSVVSCALTVFLGIATDFMADNGVMDGHGREAMLNYQMELLMDRYSIWALSDRGRNYNMDTIEKTNLHMGIISSKKDDIDTKDLADMSNYVANNFDKNFDANNVHIFKTYLDKYTDLNYDMTDIWGYARVWHDQTENAKQVQMQGFCYDWMTNKLYVQAGDDLYLLNTEYWITNADKSEATDDVIFYIDDAHDDWTDMTLLIEIPDFEYQIPVSRIEIIDDLELQDKNISQNEILNMGAGYLDVACNGDASADRTYYWVVTYLNDPLVPNGQSLWHNEDLFLQMETVFNFLYDWKYVVVVLLVLSGITLGVSALYWIFKGISFIFHAFGKIILMWKLALVLLAGFWLIVVFGLSGGGGAAFLIILYVFVFCPVVLYIGWEYRKINRVCDELAKGNIDAKIDSRHMIWDMKNQADNINAISDSINFAVEQKMKSERMKAELITNVSHDIKTPLTSIINYVDLLSREDIESETAREYIEVLDRQSNKLKKLIVDLIEASKASTGNLEIHPEEIDVRMALLQVTGEYEEKLKEAGVELFLNAPEESVMISADGRYLFRIFDNLMTNIMKYSLCNTRAYIDLTTEAESVLVVFKNISREQLSVKGEDFTERFYRGDASRNTEGNGLGLAIVKSLAELMQGTISVVVDGDLFKVEIRFPRLESDNKAGK